MKKQVSILFTTVFLYLVGFGLVIPIIPTWARDLQASSLQIGLLMSMYSLFQFIFAPVWGRWSDRFGRRPIILGCLLGESISYIVFSQAESLEMLFVARALSGFFGGSISTASAALSDLTPPEKRSAAMGLIGAAFGLGFIVGPALGGVLSMLGGPSLAGKVVSGLCLLTALFGLFFLKETHANLGQKLSRPSPWQSFVKSWDSPGLRNIFLAQGGASIAMTLMESCLILWMADRLHWKLPEINWGFVSVGVLSAFFQGFLVRKLLPLWGERRTLLLGLVFFSLGLGLIPLWEQAWWVGLCMLFFVFGNSLTNPSLLGSASLLSGAEEQGAHLGVSQSMSSLGRIVGPALGGALYLKYPPGAFFVAGILGGLVWLGLFTQRRLLPNAAMHSSSSDFANN